MKNIPMLVSLAANAEDEATGKARICIRFNKVGNRVGELSLPRQMTQNPGAVYDALIEHNADLPVASDSIRAQIATAITAPPESRHLHLARLGWNHDKTAFALATEVVGGERDACLLKSPLWISDRHHAHFDCRGTLKSWQEAVAAPAGRSSACILAVCDALAAPLLDFIDFGSFGHNLYGRSKAGKTAALMVGASVGGIGREADLLNWGASASARNESGPLFNHQFMPLNEVGLLGGSKRTAYPTIRETIYRLSEGRERLKNTASVFATLRVSSEFKVVFFSTAEHSFDDYARFKGEDRDEGEYARCLDIPINVADRRTIMDFYPKSVEPKRRLRWSDDQVIALRDGCGRNHGVALKVYLEHLIKHRAKVSARIRAHMDEFQSDSEYPKARGALAHAARNIALSYAAGMIGREAGVIPWSEKRLRAGLIRCLRRALVAAGNQETLAAAGKRDLRRFLASAAVRERKGAKPSAKAAKGYWDSIDNERVYVVHASSFRKIFAANPSRYEAVIAWLHQQGLLTAKASKGGNIAKDWAVTTPRWPDGTAVRSIVFRDPFPAA